MHLTFESQWWQRLWEKTLRSVYTSSWSLEKITLFSTIGNTEKTNFYLSFYFVNFLLLHSCSCSTSINVIRKRNISIFIVQVIQFEWYHWQFDIISLSPDCSFEKWSVPNSTNFDAVHLHIISIFNSEVEVCMCGVERGRRGYCRRGPTSPISSLGPMHLHFCTVLCMNMRIWRVTRKGEETIYNCMFRTLSRQAGTLGDIDLGPPPSHQ